MITKATNNRINDAAILLFFYILLILILVKKLYNSSQITIKTKQ